MKSVAKDGTNRGDRRVRVGKEPDPLNEKLAEGRPATKLTPPQPADLDLYDFTGDDIGDGVELTGTAMPPPSDYLSAEQQDGKPLVADLVYKETWQWLDERCCTDFVSKRLIESYAQPFAHYVQCEEAISKFGLLGKHPTTGAAFASPPHRRHESALLKIGKHIYILD